jgi:hypothetical protein
MAKKRGWCGDAVQRTFQPVKAGEAAASKDLAGRRST